MGKIPQLCDRCPLSLPNPLTVRYFYNSAMSTPPNIIPGSLEPTRLIGYPVVSFVVRERRSLTVHLEDAGWFDVACEADPNDPQADAYPVFIGRYRSFEDAFRITDQLNQVWRLFPQSTAREVAAFACQRLDFLIST
jgi:hypothetical protein